MVTTIFFDLDDTLLDFGAAEASALCKTLTQFGIAPTPQVTACYSAINQHHWELLEQGSLTRDQVLHQRFDRLFEALGVIGDSHQVQKTYEYLLSLEHPFLPGAQDLLDTLYGTYDLYLVSNGTAMVQDRRLQDSGISHYFRDIFISERIGYDKPSRAFFDHCFAAIPGLCRDHTIIVGDSLTSDIRGGNNAGIRTCWFNPKGRPRREGISVDYEITNLSQLPLLLSTI
jgi:2-haloacid dehalogenase